VTTQQDHEVIERFLYEKPLVIFSVYTTIQVDIINGIGNEILSDLDKIACEGRVSSTRLYGQFWLWVLGAYEVVRTMTNAMTGASNCFSEETQKI
jgi:hypothetical protein